MGCGLCPRPLEAESPAMISLNDPIFALITETSKSSFKISKRNYVKIKEGRLCDLYEIQEKIGEGAFGIVHRAIHATLRQPRAIKSLNRKILSKASQRQLLREIEILQIMDYPNILKIYEVVKEPDYFHIVTELLTGGDLLSKISSEARCSEGVIAGYMRQILSAVAYCHSMGFIHRDLKPENLVFDSDSECALLKVIDFGASCKMSKELRGIVGTDYYIAPEVLRDCPYDEKSDVWSCGVILYICLCGYPPFNGLTSEEIQTRILNQSLGFPYLEWKNISQDAKQLIRQMLTKDPKLRPSASSLLDHNWIKSAGSIALSDTKTSEVVLRNLKTFQSGTLFRHSTLHLIANQMITSEHYRAMRELFLSLDRDRDGKLSHTELETALKGSGWEAEADSVMQRCDVDKDGFIEFSEFLTAAMDWELVLDQKMLETAFQTFDTNSDGRISVSEMKAAISGDADTQESLWSILIEEASIDSSGIDFSDFKRLMVQRSLSPILD